MRLSRVFRVAPQGIGSTDARARLPPRGSCRYAFNVDEVDFALDAEAATARCGTCFESIQHRDPRDAFAVVSAHAEATRFDDLVSMGATPSSRVLPTIVKTLLGLSTAYTGPGVDMTTVSKTTKAHLFPRGTLTAAGLASRIHGDLEKGFLSAEVSPAATLIDHDSFADARARGALRTEGRDYVLADEDVVFIKWR